MFRYILILLLFPVHYFCKSTPDSLLIIDLQHKNLTKLPEKLEYSTVKSLLIGYNPIKTIPNEISNAKHLKNLSINYSPQFNFESSIETIKQLKLESLSINNSNLMYIPLELGEIKTLKNLSLANNYIKEIPAYIFLNAKFYSLDFSGNLISTLPKEIISQSNLSFLNLSNNSCINKEDTYKHLKELQNLKQLEVKGCEILPSNIWNLSSLENINISDGTFSSILLNENVKKNQLIQLIATNCNNLDFSSLLPVLASSTLKEISLGGDKFNGFNNVVLSSNLISLSLQGSTLSNFKLANSLSNLQELNLSFNSITCQTEFLNTVSKISTLKHLNLSNCNFTYLPSQISQLKNIESLNISNNKLTSINVLYSLKQLKTLDISFCELSKSQIDNLKKELPNTEIIYNDSSTKLPLANANVETENFIVTPTENQTITTTNGTTIMIPKNSLVFENGKVVKDPVTINYTPYYSLADIAMSGINMNYNSPEGSAPFSSAGMFNINANSNGQNVEVKKGSEIQIAFKSNDPEKSYNYYSYDSINKSWKVIGKDTITKIKVDKPVDSSIVRNDSIISTTSVNMPQPPFFYANHDITIHWDVDKKDRFTGEFNIYATLPNAKTKNDTSSNENFFTEVKELSKIRWKIDAEKSFQIIKEFSKNNELFNHNVPKRNRIIVINNRVKSHNSKTRTEKMIDFVLIADKDNDSFLFKFYNETDTISFYAYPLIQNKNIDRAQKTIKKLYFKYESSAKERKKLTKYRRDKFLSAYNRYKVNMSNSRNIMSKNEINNISKLLNSSVNTNAFDITRVLSIQGFGIYNCDRPVFIENPIVFSPIFVDENGKKLSNATVQVIDPKENIAVTYYAGKPLKISKNSIITVLNTQYGKNNTRVYLGKIPTFNINSIQNGTKIQLSLLSNEIKIGELNQLINSTN